MPQLTDEQHDGLACIVCGKVLPEKTVPIHGLRSKYGCQVFRCVGCFENLREIRDKIASDVRFSYEMKAPQDVPTGCKLPSAAAEKTQAVREAKRALAEHRTSVTPVPDVLRIVRAAIRDERGGVWSVPIPGRHHDVIREMRAAGYEGPVSGRDQQGFLLNDGRFIRRKAAYRVAKQAGQFLQGEPIAKDVTTEDLW